LKTYEQFVDAKLGKSDTPIVGISSQTVKPVGKVNLKVIYKDKSYKDIFEGTGLMPVLVSLKIDHNAQPVAHVPRPISKALREAAKSKLDALEQEGIIEKFHLVLQHHGVLPCILSSRTNQ